ncbi:uncharacterized protein SPSK_09629 [Sporothrix schenckii 1099-18]|uniref:Peptidase S54 rhomboid domain-containing protein n=2 Tax=Sporothrix schenckii TaxID=29908 RepID=U7PYY9_SPOS1|nr:uncharacterized protein SPSK_09629 [Sporothrix schenckii 1099-18]ERT00157.1 hypothetical protein HMPREF1624_03526 [Sporothrix schenckii ATCC 58251]KJR85388.1 hypothetical protein SPSK_09629 [Sporothrix schenckii 1099-18]
MSFTNAPVTRSLVFGLASASIGASLFDIKHYFYILVDPQILRYHQTWRALTYQLCYTNSSEVLFACMTLYQMRIVERMWGSRKYASFIAVTFLISAIVPPMLLFVLRVLTNGRVNYLPAGPTGVVFAILAQYYSIVPHRYTYRVAFSSGEQPPAGADDNFVGLTFSDKSYRYLLAAQLALFQWPGSILAAAVGWIVGHAWRNDVLPGRLSEWRVPGWLVGLRTQKRRDEFEGLRRRLEGENASGSATGVDGSQTEGPAGRRRPVGQQILDQFRGPI